MAGLAYATTGRTFVTADTHFGHAEACDLFARPFANVDEMDDALVERANAVMGPDDLLYHIGDFVGEMADAQQRIDHARRVRERLRVGRIILVRGNHDSRKAAYTEIFDEVHEVLSVRGWRGGEHRIVFCHYPLRVWQGNRNGSLHIYGHAHGRLEEIGRSTDVGVDSWEYAPVEIDQVLAMLTEREIKAIPERKRTLQPMRKGR